MSDEKNSKEIVTEQTEESEKVVPKSKRYRRDKPWDNDPTLDKFKIDKFEKGDMKHSMVEESSFAVLFPQYREKYIKEVWPHVKKSLKEYGVKGELNLLEGSLTVKTTRETWDPFIILKARDVIKMLARSVPYQHALRTLEDGIECDVIKIRGYTRNNERFIKRRQRLIGPKGMTLKALELLTNCYVLVQGSTVSVMGKFKDLKVIRRVILDCMNNIHPVYHIKELMIKKELSKRPELATESWDRFLPNFKKQNVKKKKVKIEPKKEYNPFPNPQKPRKIDEQLESGDYFNQQTEKGFEKKRHKRALKLEKDESIEQEVEIEEKASIKRKKKKAEAFVVPEEPVFEQKINSVEPNIDDLKNKFLGKKKKAPM